MVVVRAAASQIAGWLAEAHSRGGLVICAPVYCELLAHPKANRAFVDAFLADTGISVEFQLQEAIWRDAGSRFAAYAERRRRSGGTPAKRLLAGFVIGAHARAHADQLVTLDRVRYEQDFSDLRLVVPRREEP